MPVLSDTDLTFDYCPRLREMIRTGQVVAEDGEVFPIHSASTQNNLHAIRNLMLTEGFSSTLEIGLACGASALTILSSLQELDNADSWHTAIDPFQSHVWKSIGVNNIQSAGLSDRFTCDERESSIALPELCHQGRKFDLIYVDGSHIFEDAFVDFYYGAKLLSNNGLILFDDCTDRHVRKVIRFIDRNYQSILVREGLDVPEAKTPLRRLANILGFRQLLAYRKKSDPPREWNAPFHRF